MVTRILFTLILFVLPAPSVASLSCKDAFSDKSQYISGCPFCDAISRFNQGKGPSHFDRTVLATSAGGNFFVKSQRGGFLPGSVLIASNKHFLTRVSDMNREEFVEFFQFYEVIKNRILKSLGNVKFISFENGTVGSHTVAKANQRDSEGVCSPSGGGCLSHFHWHVSPLQKVGRKNTGEFVLPQEAKMIGAWGEFFDMMKARPEKNYTLIDFEGRLYFVDRNVHKRRSEWMRLHIAIFLKEEGLIDGAYSWRQNPRFATSRETQGVFSAD